MNQGMIRVISATAVFLLSISAAWAADIWKIVDPYGNVVYTDQAPGDGSTPMDLPELSVIETDIQHQQTLAGEEQVKALTSGELRRLYRDFRITRPLPEETFWGTANTVVVSWSSKTALTPDLNVHLFVDGRAQVVPATGGVSLTLERGEHKVFAELRDARNRRIIKTGSVTFFVKQNSVNFNRPRPTSRGGSG
ncbi:MAG: DUF4124 domain-containing protein [Xanthomonadales bacterium]